MIEMPILENNIHQTMDWVYAVEEACKWDQDNQKRALAALRAVLHALRDSLPLEDAIRLSSHLPLMIRGLFFENWTPQPLPQKGKEDFLDAIAEGLYPYQNVDAEETARGVLQVLGLKIVGGELAKIMSVVPPEIGELFRQERGSLAGA